MHENALNSSCVSIQAFAVNLDMSFEPKPGLNVVYGKNGVGKSTVVNFIEAISKRPIVLSAWNDGEESKQFAERKVRSAAEFGDGRVIVKFTAPHIVALAYKAALEIREANQTEGRRLPVPHWRWHGQKGSRVARNLTRSSSKTAKWTDEQVFDGIAQHEGESPEKIKKTIESLREEMSSSEEKLLGFGYYSIKQILQEELDPKPVHNITDALRKTVLFHYMEWNPESAHVSSINERLSTYGIDMTLDLDDAILSKTTLEDMLFGDLFLLFVDVIICRLQSELNEVALEVEFLIYHEHHERLSDFDEDNPLTFSSVRNDANEIIGIVARAIYEQRHLPLVSYDKPDGPDLNRELRLLFKMSDNEGIGEHTAAFEKLRQTWITEEDGLAIDIPFEVLVLETWLFRSTVLGFEKFDNAHKITESLPFYELRFAMGDIEDVPFDVFRLDDSLDIDRVLSEVAAETLNKELFEALAILADNELQDDELSEFVEPLNRVFEPVSQFIAALGIGIEGVRVRVSPEMDDWVSGQGVKFEFITTTSTYGASFEQLSTAQQLWVKAGMWFVAAQKADTRVLVIADEPDRSLHERAAYNVMEALSGSGLDVIVSSHSVAALRTRNATLHHLEVGPDGRRTVSEVAVGEDVLVAAERFGTTPYDLLSLKRMMVVVEGSHDAAVIARVMKLSENRLLADRVLVAPMRGVKNVVSVADSILVTEFSELNLLVVVDNGRNDVFGPILAELRERDSAGASEKELKRILNSHLSGRDASYEERMLFDLLERAIHRGILRRLDLFALSVGDVVELLPAAGFNSEHGWDELRRQYERSSVRTDFKTWLKETHQISISVRTVEKAFDNPGSLHPELIRLLQQIELGCSVG